MYVSISVGGEVHAFLLRQQGRKCEEGELNVSVMAVDSKLEVGNSVKLIEFLSKCCI